MEGWAAEQQLYSAPQGTCTAELARTLGRGLVGSSVALCVHRLVVCSKMGVSTCCKPRRGQEGQDQQGEDPSKLERTVIARCSERGMNANVFEFYIDTCLPSLSLLPWLSAFLAFSPPISTHARENPKHGRYHWQQDLAQELIADALGTEWGRTDEEREARSPPWWTHTRGLVPCDCKTCFHCKAQLTYGIAHPALSPEQQQVAAQKRIRAEGKKTGVKRQRNEHAYVDVLGHSQYCEVCRDHWVEQQPGWSEADIRVRCNASKKGCVPCRKRICKECYRTWDHRAKRTGRTEWKGPPKKSTTKKGRVGKRS